jgi:hypothetical protein
MSTDKRILAIAVATAFSLNTMPAADDITAILNQIQTEGSGKKNTTIEKTPVVAPTQTPTPKKKKIASGQKSIAQEKPAPKVAPRPQIPILKATDKLPKNFRGMGLAGKFKICGTDGNGCPQIIAAEEDGNPFARQFWIINGDAQLVPYRSFRLNERPSFEVPTSKPLIFVGIFMPGIYNVRLQTED